MITINIDGKNVRVQPGTTILAAARKAKIDVPTLCAYEGLSCVGACRVCVVEVVGRKRLVAACNTPVEPGMKVVTNSPRVLKARKANLELILSEHNTDCTKCVRN